MWVVFPSIFIEFVVIHPKLPTRIVSIITVANKPFTFFIITALPIYIEKYELIA